MEKDVKQEVKVEEPVEKVVNEERGYLEWTKLIYPKEKKHVMERFQRWCKEHAGNKYIVGIEMLLDLSDYFGMINSLNYRIAILEEKFEALTAEPVTEAEVKDEGIKTLGGGKVK